MYLSESGMPSSTASVTREVPGFGDRVGAHGCSWVTVWRPGVDTEVHIRKLDTDSKLHWRLLASVDVAADAAAIWAVLTDYAALGSVVPVISVSEVVPRGGGGRRHSAAAAAPPGLRRVRQVAAKRLPYVQLRAEVELDVLEKPAQQPGDVWELQFKQHRSDFDVLQVCPPHGTLHASCDCSPGSCTCTRAQATPWHSILGSLCKKQLRCAEWKGFCPIKVCARVARRACPLLRSHTLPRALSAFARSCWDGSLS